MLYESKKSLGEAVGVETAHYRWVIGSMVPFITS
jgi:hypothetical protein